MYIEIVGSVFGGGSGNGGEKNELKIIGLILLGLKSLLLKKNLF